MVLHCIGYYAVIQQYTTNIITVLNDINDFEKLVFKISINTLMSCNMRNTLMT